MKNKFNSYDNLNKQLKFLSVTIIVRSVFEEDGKYYPRVFLNECLYYCIILETFILVLMVNGKTWKRKTWKEFSVLKNIDQKCYCSNYYEVSVNKYGAKCGALLKLSGNKGWIHSIDPYGWFQWF